MIEGNHKKILKRERFTFFHHSQLKVQKIRLSRTIVNEVIYKHSH